MNPLFFWTTSFDGLGQLGSEFRVQDLLINAPEQMWWLEREQNLEPGFRKRCIEGGVGFKSVAKQKQLKKLLEPETLQQQHPKPNYLNS